MIMSPIPGTQAVARAVALLKLFSDAAPERGLGDLAKAAGLHRATAHRLLAALEREGMVARDESGERYRLGPDAIALGARATRATDLRSACRAELLALAAETGETATLEVPVRGDMLIADEVVGKALISATASAGTSWPAHATSTGKAVLAVLPDDERRAMLGRKLSRPTARTIVSQVALARDLALTRKRGYAVATEELERGYVAVGAAILDQSGRPVGALSVGGPTVRFPARRIASLGTVVRAAAGRVSAALGYRLEARAQ
jgi:IclR family transcriptional regulator, acetate operon repressor